jgi:hypothetical protein
VQLLSTRLDWVPCGWIAIVDGISCADVASHRTAAACVEGMGTHTAWGSKLLFLTPRLCYLETLRLYNIPWCIRHAATMLLFLLTLLPSCRSAGSCRE